MASSDGNGCGEAVGHLGIKLADVADYPNFSFGDGDCWRDIFDIVYVNIGIKVIANGDIFNFVDIGEEPLDGIGV